MNRKFKSITLGLKLSVPVQLPCFALDINTLVLTVITKYCLSINQLFLNINGKVHLLIIMVKFTYVLKHSLIFFNEILEYCILTEELACVSPKNLRIWCMDKIPTSIYVLKTFILFLMK